MIASSPVIVALILVSALLHASWNALLRVEPDRDRGLVAAVGIATVIAAAVALVRWAAGATLFAGAAAFGWALVAGVFECVYFIALAAALDRGALGPVYTISRGGAILVVWPLSIALYGEAITVLAAAGSAVVLVGIGLSSAGTRSPSPSRAPGGGAVAWAITCALAIAAYHLAYKAALAAGGNSSAVFAVALALATALNLARLGAAGRRAAAAILTTRTRRVLVMGALCAGSFLILVEALAGGGAGFVLTLRNTSVLFATALAALVGDRPRAVQIAGAALVAAGTVLMAWP